MLVPRLGLHWANDFGDNKRVPDSSFSTIGFDTELRFNFAAGAHIAAAYYWMLDNAFGPPNPPERQTQRFNLRAAITF